MSHQLQETVKQTTLKNNMKVVFVVKVVCTDGFSQTRVLKGSCVHGGQLCDRDSESHLTSSRQGNGELVNALEKKSQKIRS